jgi:hypothetical protein
LFPAAVTQESGLCDKEAAEMSDDALLPLLKDLAESHDPALKEAIQRLEAKKVSREITQYNSLNLNFG